MGSLQAFRSRSGFTCVLVLAIGPSIAQDQWRRVPVVPSGRVQMVVDSLRSRVLAVSWLGSNPRGRLFEWDGQWWSERLDRGPSTTGTMMFDGRKLMLVDGGRQWTFDGIAWNEEFPALVPPSYGPVAAYDSARRRIVLYGGLGMNYTSHATYEWDGQQWYATMALPAGPVYGPHYLAYDEARGECVMLASWGTFTYRNGVWTPRNLTGWSPPMRDRAAMAYDAVRQRVVFAGGWGGTGDTAEWTGSVWLPSGATSEVVGAGMAFDPVRRRIMMAGGEDARGDPLSITRSYDGVAWSTTRPDGRLLGISPPAAYDAFRRSIVAITDSPWPNNYGGWTWRSSGLLLEKVYQEWSVPETGGAMAFDPLRQRVVLFGGQSRRWGVHSTTLLWNGQAWQQLVVSGPPARHSHAMAFDHLNNAVLLFGGVAAPFTLLNDTWRFNGTWSRQQPTASPGARYAAAMASDPVRRRIVLFGGRQGTATVNDTWEWDGVGWVSMAPPVAPADRAWSAMAFDPARGDVVLHGGAGAAGQVGDTWAWNGSAWTNLGLTHEPRHGHAMVYDEDRQALLVVGGVTPNAAANGLEPADGIQLVRARADGTDFGSACGRVGLTGDVPYAGNLSHRLEVRGAPPNAPCFVAYAEASTPQRIGACTWHLSGAGHGVFVLADQNGFASLPAAIGLGVALHGMQVFAQAGVLDPSGPLGGVALTNARRMIVGG